MNDSIKVSVGTVDGGLQEWDEGRDFVKKLDRLVSEGWQGKELVHRLITDDWAAPPRYVEINIPGRDPVSIGYN